MSASLHLAPRLPLAAMPRGMWEILTLAALLGTQPVGAQEVFGILRGAVSDQAGGAAAGARVVLPGTAFAVTTDERGRYEFPLVPAGTYTVRAVGGDGAVAEYRSLWVAPGGTTSLDLVLGFAAGGGAGAFRDAVPVSGSALTGEELSRTSTDDPRQALAGTPGTVLRAGTIGITPGVGLAVRGGPPGAASGYIDGAPVRFLTLGGHTLVPGVNTLAEVALTTGVSGVRVADARGGVIGYLTRIGGSELRSAFRVESDEVLGSGSAVGYTRLAADAGGAAPGIRHLTWSVSGLLQGQRSAYRGIGAADTPLFAVGGMDTVVQRTLRGGATVTDTVYAFVPVDGQRRPFDWTTRRLVHGRLLYTFASNASLSVTALVGDLQQRAYPGTNLMDPALYAGARTASRFMVVNWGQPLGPLARGAVTLEANLSLASDDYGAGPLTREAEAGTRDPWLGIGFGTLRFSGTDVFPFPFDQTYIRRLRNNDGPLVPYADRNDLLNVQSARTNPYGLAAGWPTQGLGARVTLVSERRLFGRWQLHWRRNTVHHATIGLDVDRADVTWYDAHLITRINIDAFSARPRRVGLFAGHRLGLGDVTIDGGLRYDRYTAGAEFPKAPGRIITNPDWNPETPSDTTYAARVGRVFDRARSRGIVSPRFRVSYALSPRSTIRLAYGALVETPDYRDLYSGTNADLVFTSTWRTFGRDVAFASTTLMELGVRHAWRSTLALDIALYNRRLVAYGPRLTPVYDPFRLETTLLGLLSRLPDRRILGADVRLLWRARDVMTGSVSYSLVSAGSASGSDPVTTHAVYATVALRAPQAWTTPGGGAGLLRDLDALVTVRLTSGEAYTRVVNEGRGIISPGATGQLIEAYNGSRLPWTRLVDLRLTRTVRLSGRSWTLFADARNLLNVRNLVAVFAETGTDANAIHRARLTAPELAILRSEAAQAVLAPDGTIDLRADCASWSNPTNCVALRRVERRFGDGDGVYTPTEQTRAFNAYYDAFFGPARFYGPGRTLRIGIELQH